MTRTALLNVMINGIRKVSRNLIRDFGEIENLQISSKGSKNFITNANLRVETALIKFLKDARPGYGIISKKSGSIIGTDKTHRWIINSIDGIINFMHANPYFCISLALERNGLIYAGVIYNPITNELFETELKHGAFLNNIKLRISNRYNLSDALITTGETELHIDAHLYYRRIAKAHAYSNGLRIYGSTGLDLANLAAGRSDCFWNNGIKIYDIAAGVLMIKEAGGKLNNLDGSDFDINSGCVAATNINLMPSFINMLKIS